MAMTAADPVFVDTNMLVYARIAVSPFHAAAVTKLDALKAAGHPLWVSRQILREYLAALTKPGTVTVPLPIAVLVADVQSFELRFSVAEDGPAVTSGLLNLLKAVGCGGKQVHDANIVATMQAHGIPKLLTHNVADFNRFAAYITVLPLVP
jgi:predicted nucleic acid-binding protein